MLNPDEDVFETFKKKTGSTNLKYPYQTIFEAETLPLWSMTWLIIHETRAPVSVVQSFAA